LHAAIVHLLQGVTLGFTATATPGPFQAYLLNQTTRRGIKHTLPLCLAPLLSDGPIILVVVGILSQASGVLLRAIQVLGGLFLLYLAVRAVRAARKATPGPDQAPKQSFAHAILMNFLSPGPYLFWSTVTGPMFLKAWSKSVVGALAFVCGFYLILIGGFMVFVVLSGNAIKLLPKVEKGLHYVSALALLGFGLYQLWTGLAG
jgi:threonine/homoserine/homoserine lactone efflux protein